MAKYHTLIKNVTITPTTTPVVDLALFATTVTTVVSSHVTVELVSKNSDGSITLQIIESQQFT